MTKAYAMAHLKRIRETAMREGIRFYDIAILAYMQNKEHKKVGLYSYMAVLGAYTMRYELISDLERALTQLRRQQHGRK